ncbi:hypothetical protein BX070DRAFT_151206 [Coemansia spiralis]|nr:hypothetical protein BX070DRAFT_151206 [Coemansia spiralis]
MRQTRRDKIMATPQQRTAILEMVLGRLLTALAVALCWNYLTSNFGWLLTAKALWSFTLH